MKIFSKITHYEGIKGAITCLVQPLTDDEIVDRYGDFVHEARFPDAVELLDVWDIVDGEIIISVDDARFKAHDIRRYIRGELLRPLDEQIAKQIPGEFETIEAQRQVIRDRDTAVQMDIDSSSDVPSIINIIRTYKGELQ